MMIYQKQIYSPFPLITGLKESKNPMEYIQSYDRAYSAKYTDNDNNIYDVVVLSIENKTFVRVCIHDKQLIRIDCASVPIGNVKEIVWQNYFLNNKIGKLYIIQ
jgi:hypothetical protein